MPTELRDNQHELLLPDGSLSLVFGTATTGFLATAYPAIESGDAQLGDVQRVREDGVSFGEDYLTGKTYTFEVAVLSDRAANPERAGSEALNVLEGVWRDERFRKHSWSYGMLRSRFDGFTTRCYGRPRRYAETTGRATRKGHTPVIADFAVADGRWYDDNERQAQATLHIPSEGGLIAPLVAPLTTTAESHAGSVLEVGGRLTTWPVVTFHAPNGVHNPKARIGSLVIGLRTTIPAGMSVTVDPRPWVRTVTRSDGANQAGKLTHDTPPLRECLIPRGRHSLQYSGHDNSASSTVEVTWRDAYARP